MNKCGNHDVSLPSGKSFYISQDELIMCTYNDGRKVKEYPVSTGADATLTDVKLLNNRPLEYYVMDQFWYKDWKCYADYVWSWGRGMYLIHGPPYDLEEGEKKYYSFNGWGGLEVAGNCRSSHGCIRLGPDDIKDFTDWIREGDGDPTKVIGFISDNPKSPDCAKACIPSCRTNCEGVCNGKAPGQCICDKTEDCRKYCFRD